MNALPDGLPYWSNPVELAVPVGAIETVAPGDTIYYVGVFAPMNRIMLRAGTIGAVDSGRGPTQSVRLPMSSGRLQVLWRV